MVVFLPDCIILKILSYLEKVELITFSRVSRKWYELCLDKSLWKSVLSLEFADQDIERQNDYTLKALLKNFNLEKLDMSDCVNLSNRTLMSVALTSTKLSSLNLQSCGNITDRSITTVALHCKSLVEINLCQTRVTDIGLIELFEANPLLKDVTVSPSALSENAMGVLTKSCRNLECLVAEYCSTYDHNKACLSSSMLAMIASGGCTNVVILVLKYPIVNIDDTSLSLLGHFCTKLECIEIQHVFFHSLISDHGLINLCYSLKNLQRLVISYSSITDLTVHSLCHRNKKLTQLSLKYCQKVSDMSVANLVQCCNRLESLTIGSGWGGKLTNISALAIAQSKCVENLLRIDMYGWDINDNGLLLLLTHLPKLLNLSIEHCHFITKNGFLHALKFVPRLLSLDISSANCLEHNADLLELGLLVPNLTLLTMNNCRNIDIDAVNEFRNLFPICDVISNI